jgi:hypothetical protein
MASAPIVFLVILLGGIAAAAVWVALAALRHTDDEPRRQIPPVGKVVAGPVLRDGVWCRLVVFPDGYRRVEVLGPEGWVPGHRDVAHLLQAIPGRSGTSAKRP